MPGHLSAQTICDASAEVFRHVYFVRQASNSANLDMHQSLKKTASMRDPQRDSEMCEFEGISKRSAILVLGEGLPPPLPQLRPPSLGRVTEDMLDDQQM